MTAYHGHCIVNSSMLNDLGDRQRFSFFLAEPLKLLLAELLKLLLSGMALTAHVDYVGLSYHNLDFCNTIKYQTQNFGF